MPDLPSNEPISPQGKKKELSMELRLLIAFLLMGVVLFVTPYFYKPAPGPKAPPPVTSKQAEQLTAKPPETPAKTDAKPTQSAPSTQVKAETEKEFTVDTDLYRIRFTNRGAVVKSWLLKKFTDHAGKPLELVNAASFNKVPPPFSIFMKDEQTAQALNYALFAAKPSADELGIDYEFSDGKTVCHKSFHFVKNSYLSRIESEVTQNNAPVPHWLQWRGGFGDPTVQNRAAAQHSVYYDPHAKNFFGIEGKLITNDVKAAKDGVVIGNGNFLFAGLDDTFFAAVLLLSDSTATEVRTFKDDVVIGAAAKEGETKEDMAVGVAVGGDSRVHTTLFVGPKDIDILSKVDPKLQQLVDWGTFGIIAKGLFFSLHYINDRWVNNYGWSIVLITILINLILFPARLQSLKSAKKMQALKPQIDQINAKYKNVGLRDPKKADQNQEIMDLYKKHGANPLGGCLPMLIQLPILWAFYKVLTVTIEMRGAHWLWVSDLSQPEQLPIHLLPIIMIVTQFLMQKMTPSPGMDPNQARMMLLMPLMFGFFFYNMSSGLVLYWLTGNLVGILQQFLVNKMIPAPVIEAPKTAPQVKKKR